MIFENPFARIAVGYDGSAPSEAALGEALELARQYGGEVVVANVAQIGTASALPLATAAAAMPSQAPVLASLDPSRRALFDALSGRVAACSVPVTVEFSTNAPAAGIIDAATRWNATAIALGTHARKGFAHAVIGSVAEEVVRTARIPVVVVREGTPANALQRVAVGIDASEASGNAMVFGVALARERSVRLVCFSVVDTNSVMQPMADMPFDPAPFLAELRSAARDALDSARQYATAAGLYPDTEITEAVDTASGTLDVARRHGADAIVIGTHKRSTFERFMLGSTAVSVLRRSDVPVIVVPANAVLLPGVQPAIAGDR